LQPIPARRPDRQHAGQFDLELRVSLREGLLLKELLKFRIAKTEVDFRIIDPQSLPPKHQRFA
jgi:hypothetical protein